jgi:hypothetical protein
MDHTIGHEHIGCDNLGTIDPHAIVCNSNGDVAPVDRGERAVGERRTLFHNTVNDIIREDVGKLLSREIGNSDAIALKSSLVGANMVTSLRELTVSIKSAAVKAPARAVRLAATRVSRIARRQGKDPVDNMDGTTGEVQSLARCLLVGW